MGTRETGISLLHARFQLKPDATFDFRAFEWTMDTQAGGAAPAGLPFGEP